MDANKEPQTVLMVAYYFPPSGSVGARRTLKFARYLPEFNWRPIVLTVNENLFSDRDSSSNDQVSHVQTHRTRCWSFDRLARNIRKRTVNSADADLTTDHRPYIYQGMVGIKRFLQSLMIPDTEIGWLPFALYRGLKVIRLENVKLIYASSPPPTTLLVGTLLSLFSKVPLVLDLRDTWAIHPDWLYLEENRGILSPIYRVRVFFENILEKVILKRAKAVVLNTNAMYEVYKTKHPSAARNMVTITNGFDSNDFRLAPTNLAHDDFFSLVFVGSYYGFHSPDYFLKGLHHLFGDKPDIAKLLTVSFVGNLETTSSRQLIKELGLRESIRLVDRVPHDQAIGWLKSADALLLTLPPKIMVDWWIPAKLFEYLAARKPILGVMPDGAAAQLIRDSGNGIIVDPYSPEKISAQLYKLFVDAHKDKIEKSGINIEQFEYRILTGKIATLFARVLQE